jgi:hypothetical protein
VHRKDEKEIVTQEVKPPIIDKVIEKPIVEGSEEFEEVLDEQGNVIRRKKGLGTKIKDAVKGMFGAKQDVAEERLP